MMPMRLLLGKKGHLLVPFHISGVEGWITPRLFNIDFPLAKRLFRARDPRSAPSLCNRYAVFPKSWGLRYSLFDEVIMIGSDVERCELAHKFATCDSCSQLVEPT